jgi:hypothetical protein
MWLTLGCGQAAGPAGLPRARPAGPSFTIVTQLTALPECGDEWPITRADFIIAKDSCTYTILILRQDKKLRDHGDLLPSQRRH